jgi:putative ABC transport system substrate-binding protein
VIGYLSSGSREVSGERLRRFLQGLSEAGYSEGKNIAIEYRWGEGQYDRLPQLAADLVARRVRVIVVPDSIVTARAAKVATSTIPIVSGIGADPVKSGLVMSLSRPSGNLTGAARLNVELGSKRLQMLHAFRRREPYPYPRRGEGGVPGGVARGRVGRLPEKKADEKCSTGVRLLMTPCGRS